MDTIKKFLKSKAFWGVLGIIILVGAYFLFSGKTSAAPAKYQLSAVEKGTIATSVSGTGQVTTENQIEIKPRVSSILKAIKVVNGQKVKKGDVVAILDNSDAQKTARNASLDLQNAEVSLQKTQQPNDQFTIDSAKSDLDQANLALQKLQNPPTALDLQTTENAVAQAQRSVDQAKDAYSKLNLSTTQNLQTTYDNIHTSLASVYQNTSDIEKDLYKIQWNIDDLSAFQDHLYAYRNILGQNSPLIDDVIATYTSANNSYKTATDQYNLKIGTSGTQYDVVNELLTSTIGMERDLYRALESGLSLFDQIRTMSGYKTFYISNIINALRPTLLTEVTTINNNITTLQNLKNDLENNNNNTPLDINTAQANISSAEDSLKEKQLALEKLKAGATPEDLITAQEKVKQRQQALDKLQQGATELDLKSAQLSVQAKKNALADAQEQLSYYTVKAPFDGIISVVNVVNTDMISSGTSIATLINSQTMAQLSLNEVDAAKVKIDNPAMMTFDAIDGLTISGNVSEIDSVGTVTQGVVSFNVKIALDTDDARIKPGMSVSANVITDVKQDILTVPNGAIKTQNGNSYVETLDNVTPITDSSTGIMTATVPGSTVKTQISVETGVSNDTSTEIVSGLNEGDLVISKTITTNTSTATSASGSTRSATSILGGGGFGGGGFGGARPGG